MEHLQAQKRGGFGQASRGVVHPRKLPVERGRAITSLPCNHRQDFSSTIHVYSTISVLTTVNRKKRLAAAVRILSESVPQRSVGPKATRNLMQVDMQRVELCSHRYVQPCQVLSVKMKSAIKRRWLEILRCFQKSQAGSFVKLYLHPTKSTLLATRQFFSKATRFARL